MIRSRGRAESRVACRGSEKQWRGIGEASWIVNHYTKKSGQGGALEEEGWIAARVRSVRRHSPKGIGTGAKLRIMPRREWNSNFPQKKFVSVFTFFAMNSLTNGVWKKGGNRFRPPVRAIHLWQ